MRQTEEDYRHFQQTPLPETIPAHLRDLFREVSHRLPELWPALSNPQKKELLRSLIAQVIVKRVISDQLEIRIVWISGCYTDYTTLTPIHRDQDVSGYEPMVNRIRELWQQNYNDEQMAQQLTSEGFHSARSAHVTPKSVQKIRLARQWYLPFERMRRVEEVEGYLTARGLAKQLQVNDSTVYRFIYTQVIPPESVRRDAASGVYWICNDPQLIEQLRQRVIEKKRKNGLLKPPTAL